MGGLLSQAIELLPRGGRAWWKERKKQEQKGSTSTALPCATAGEEGLHLLK